MKVDMRAFGHCCSWVVRVNVCALRPPNSDILNLHQKRVNGNRHLRAYSSEVPISSADSAACTPILSSQVVLLS